MSVQPLTYRRPRTEDVTTLRMPLALPIPEVEQCPGLLVRHRSGQVECIEDPACSGDPALHLGTVECGEILGGCCS